MEHQLKEMLYYNIVKSTQIWLKILEKLIAINTINLHQEVILK